MKKLELYIHIPFCKKKCAYCDFLSFATTEEMHSRYVDALIMEIEQYKEVALKYKISTIFIGGGTPSILSIVLMEKIVGAIKRSFELSSDVEFTIEVNPGTVDEDKLKKYKKLGINRISIGLQATNDEELRILGRIHTYEKFVETYDLARKCGINNINIDLISSIPSQTVESWETTLKRVIELKPEHISAYSLIIEEGTEFYNQFDEIELLLPTEEEERTIYYTTKSLLENSGYHRYEISNYCKKGMECQHNLGYWECKEYLGIGLGSASLLDGARYTNEKELDRYISLCQNGESVWAEEEKLDVNSRMEEFMFLGLRKMDGVSISEFYRVFQKDIHEVYGTKLNMLCDKKLISLTEDVVRLTEEGIDVSNYVMAEFLF